MQAQAVHETHYEVSELPMGWVDPRIGLGWVRVDNIDPRTSLWSMDDWPATASDSDVCSQ